MKRMSIALVALFAVLFTVPAHADVFGGRTDHRLSALQNQDLAYPVEAGTILADLTKISSYLGVREGFFYDFNQSDFCNYAASTLYTTDAGVSVSIGALNTDGFASTVDYNVGAHIPSENVPLMNLLQYLYVGAGIGARDIDNGDGQTKWRAAYGVDTQLKFTF